MRMANPDISTAISHWPDMTDCLFVPYTEAEYDRLVALLNSLVDTVGEEETHPLASLMEVMGILIEQYETEHVPELASEDRQPLCNTWMSPEMTRRASTRGPSRTLFGNHGWSRANGASESQN